MFLSLQEVLQNYAFCDVTKLQKMQGCHWYEVKRIKLLFANKGNCRKRFGAPLYYLKYSSCYFFTKTDFKQYFKQFFKLNWGTISGNCKHKSSEKKQSFGSEDKVPIPPLNYLRFLFFFRKIATFVTFKGDQTIFKAIWKKIPVPLTLKKTLVFLKFYSSEFYANFFVTVWCMWYLTIL